MLQSDSGSEIEDLMNPKDELKKKIVTLAGTMKEWDEKTKEARKSVRMQLLEIRDLGLNKYKMEKTELRDLINTIFEYHGISDSWLRKMLPKELKDPSKIRLSYIQKQEIAEERQRLLLLQQQSPKPQQQEFEAKTEHESLPDGSTTITSSYESQDSKSSLPPYETEINQSLDPKTSVPPLEETRKTIQDKRIKGLEAEVRRLSEEFVVKTPFHAFEKDILLAIRIDPIKKVIIESWMEYATSI